MEELRELTERLKQERPAPWETLPDLALYMDQLISYMPRQLIRFDESDVLTSAMVNNYIKDGLLPRAAGKRYNRTHLACLTAICALKQVLSVREMKTLVQDGAEAQEPFYDYFCRELDAALNETARGLREDLSREDLPSLALSLALRSYVNKLACQRVLALLQEERGEEVPADKKSGRGKDKNKEKSE